MTPSPPWRQHLAFVASIIGLTFVFGLHTPLAGQQGDDDPELRLRASPLVGFAPVDILFVGEIRGGADSNEELYCLSIEWDWGDETISQETLDCDPFEPGVSEIRRRFSVRHIYDYGGRYEVRLHLKRRDDILLSGRTRIEVRGVNNRLR